MTAFLGRAKSARGSGAEQRDDRVEKAAGAQHRREVREQVVAVVRQQNSEGCGADPAAVPARVVREDFDDELEVVYVCMDGVYVKAPELMKDIYLGAARGWNRHRTNAGEGHRLTTFTHILT